MKLKLTTTLVSIFSLVMAQAACVTTHKGAIVKSEKVPLIVSCNPRTDIGTEQYKFVACTFENKGSTWMDVKVKEISFEPAEIKTAKLMSPDETKNFVAAYSAKLAQDQHNTDMLLGALAIGGVATALVGVHNHNSNVALAGAATAAGAEGTAAVREISKDYNTAQNGDVVRYGSDHILAEEFKLPAELFVRKTAIVDVSNTKSYPTHIKLCFEKPMTDCLNVPVGSDRKGVHTWD